MKLPFRYAACVLAVLCALPGAHPASASTLGYLQHNLVSDLPGLAANTDPNLVNPWGIAFSPTSPFWIANNGTGTSTLYTGSGASVPLIVNIPVPGGGTGAPTGAVFNGGGGFSSDLFLFATEDGTIVGWQTSLGTTAAIRVDNSASGAIYKSLALGNNGLIYATNFHAGTVDVFDTNFAQVFMTGAFADPNLPSGFAPFGIHNIGGKLYVTYAKTDANAEDDVAGPGNGFVDVYDLNGTLLQRLVVGVPGNASSPVNSPWGVVLAPSNFGAFANKLLIGNFGDGKVNAFDPTTGAFLGELTNAQGKAIVNEGLWDMAFGSGSQGFQTNALYFTAGIPGPGGVPEDHGLFGSIQAVPEPATWAFTSAGVLFLVSLRRLKRR